MTDTNKRLFGGAAAVALVASAGGFLAARLTAPGVPAPSAEAPAEAEKPASETVILNAAAIKEAGIATETIASGGLSAEIVAQAAVSASPTGEAIVTARAAGAVVRLLKRLGDPVRAGEPLAIVESRDAAQFASDIKVAAARSTLAQKGLARERYLYEQKVSSRADYEKAQAEAATAAAEAQRARSTAGAAKVTSDGRGVMVASPISGRVTAITAKLGAFVQPETELFRVADPREVQIEAAIGSLDAARLAPGDRAVIELPDGRTVDGRVRAVTPTLNTETRAATAVIDMASAGLPPGLAVRVRILPSRGGGSTAIVVAEESVQSLGGRDVVFVRTPQGFRARPVTTGQRSAGRIEIVSGLQPGQVVATTNAFLLKAELGKSAGEEE
ncbi:MAG: efflux RND transporter periplasmic adaptor subunit [Sphingomonas sp.]|jgi:cobalt-zinc-cadmium efflux system membrane fusion protein|uniref:efflux RND transporter periplasmic adaptor subunit n=1 Tax=unclassified Sphingomonas TaxID=196159 RepID=UPI00082975E5|nr:MULTISPECIES: efflux RND transporter periplasmic adaptor subunit [unclassified Sphingomonas]MBX9860604.1 efflux RND transporter periplasmic adaptor subunit [Sphingomonas sp.]